MLVLRFENIVRGYYSRFLSELKESIFIIFQDFRFLLKLLKTECILNENLKKFPLFNNYIISPFKILHLN